MRSTYDACDRFATSNSSSNNVKLQTSNAQPLAQMIHQYSRKQRIQRTATYLARTVRALHLSPGQAVGRLGTARRDTTRKMNGARTAHVADAVALRCVAICAHLPL